MDRCEGMYNAVIVSGEASNSCVLCMFFFLAFLHLRFRRSTCTCLEKHFIYQTPNWYVK